MSASRASFNGRAWIETLGSRDQPDGSARRASFNGRAWIETQRYLRRVHSIAVARPSMGARGLKPMIAATELILVRRASFNGRAWIETARVIAPTDRMRRASFNGRAWIETICAGLTLAGRPVARPSMGARGLKPMIAATELILVRRASFNGRAWIETDIFSDLQEVLWVARPSMGARGLKLKESSQPIAKRSVARPFNGARGLKPRRRSALACDLAVARPSMGARGLKQDSTIQFDECHVSRVLQWARVD